MPEPDDSKIVRVNAGNDSNNQRQRVLETTKRYQHKFYNTSIPNFEFPGPVVFTANREEEREADLICIPPVNLMFVRLRVSVTNLTHVRDAIVHYTSRGVPVVLTYMAYYSDVPKYTQFYEWRERHINSYWCPKEEWKLQILKSMKDRLVSNCDYLCKDCMSCESYYWQTLKRMRAYDRS
jgi:hypothetical protein